MAEYQLLRCMVSLGGDGSTVVLRDRSRPILFPELVVLQFMHGEEAVTDVHVVGTCEMSTDEAMTRLVTIYGADVIKEIFPGARPNLPRADGSIPFCTLPVYVAGPTLPDSPDPKLRPLDAFTMTPHMPRRVSPAPPRETEPTPDEIAAHHQDEEPEDSSAVDTLADELGLGVPSKPDATGAVLGQGRPNLASNRSGRNQGGQRPDVASATQRIAQLRSNEVVRG
jgi:hypothetical protein